MKRSRISKIRLLPAVLALACGPVTAAGAPSTPAPPHSALRYPASPRGPVVDDYFGTKVPDPWRWLEQDLRNSDSVATWVAAQESLTAGYLAALPERGWFEERLTRLWDYERTSTPVRAAGRLYFTHNDGLQSQPVLYVQDTPEAEPRVVLDPNTLSADGTVSITGWKVSDDGRHLAWGTSSGGTDWQEWRVRDLATGADLPDVVRWIRYSDVHWSRKGDGFYYSRYAEPKEGTAYTGRNLFHKLCFHRIGTDPSEDVVVHERKDQPEWLIQGVPSEDGRWLHLLMSLSGRNNRWSLLDLDNPGSAPIVLVDEFVADFQPLGNDGSIFYARTNRDAPLGRIIAVDAAHPEPERWRTIVPEGSEALRSASLVGDRIFLATLQDAASLVQVHDLEGRHVRTLDLPGLGTASGFGGRRSDTDLFYSFSSYAVPPTIYRHDLATGKSTPWRRAKVDFRPDDYTTERVFVTGKDGTRIPLFLTHRKGLVRDGRNAVLLYAYGGFNQPQVPGFSVGRIGWLEAGGVLAVVCARGGGEYGKAWHDAAIKTNKQRTFDDVIAAAEWLVGNEFTAPSKLAIQGGSNGGMVMGAVLNQRPELFGAALLQAGVMDMLRYQHFTIGRAWSYDYGLSENEPEFRALLAYSPYHNLKPGTRYPATLVTTADFDDRVVPGHSFKYIAALQAAQAGPEPVLVRIEGRAGHTSGLKPVRQNIEQAADLWAFLAHHLGLAVPAAP